MVIRWRYQKKGGHIHVRCFTAKGRNFTFAKNGDLVFDEDEWDFIRDSLHKAVEILPEDGDPF